MAAEAARAGAAEAARAGAARAEAVAAQAARAEAAREAEIQQLAATAWTERPFSHAKSQVRSTP